MEASGFFFLFFSPSPLPTNLQSVIKCHRERGNGLLKRKTLIFFFEEYHQEQAMINTHNWNKLQLTAEKHLPAVDRRKLLTAFSHSVKKKREAEKGTLPSSCKCVAPACTYMYRSTHTQHARRHVCIYLHVQTCYTCGSKPNVCTLMVVHSPMCVGSLHVCACPLCRAGSVPVVPMEREPPGRHRLLPQGRGSDCVCAYACEVVDSPRKQRRPHLLKGALPVAAFLKRRRSFLAFWISVLFFCPFHRLPFMLLFTTNSLNRKHLDVR